LKVLFFIHGMSAGGAERQASLLCNHWARTGRQVVLATLREGPSHYDLHDAIVRRAIRADSTPSGLTNQWADLNSIRRLIAQERPDVVTSFMDAINIKVLFAGGRSGVPIVISERSVPESPFLYGRFVGAAVVGLRRLIYPLSSALVVQTEPVARWARGSRLSRRIAVIPNVVEVNRSVSEIEPSPRAKVVLSVGRLSHEKGHDVLIRAFAQVAERFSDWRLKIIGDGVSRQQLSALIDSLAMQDRIELAPIQKSVARDYCSAGVFVLPSRFEGFPNALIEAMQTGCAALAADCPVGPREIISHGTDGLLFRNEDAADLASQLMTLMRDGELRKALGARARETVRKYEPEVILPMWDRLLDDVITQRRA
jgi:glycosyltransferase involved in cell wall biosynthesis